MLWHRSEGITKTDPYWQSSPALRRRMRTAGSRFRRGHNYANQRQQVTDVSSGTIEGYVTRFCQEHAKSSFTDAVFRMSDDFSGRGAPLLK